MPHLQWTVSKWKSVLWSDESKFDVLVGNHGFCVLRAKEEGDLPACHPRSVQKPVSLMVWGRAVVKSTFVESKTSPSPKRFESESSPSPKRFESESSPSPKRFESKSKSK